METNRKALCLMMVSKTGLRLLIPWSRFYFTVKKIWGKRYGNTLSAGGE
jgi:hypothetical protein